MISGSLVNAIVAWATGDDARIAQLVAERDALVAAILGIGGTAGKATGTITSASANGKSFTFDPTMTREDKLSLLTTVLLQLGEIDEADVAESVTYGNFTELNR